MLVVILLSILMGIIGGVANSLLIEDGFALPFVMVGEHNRRVWHAGFLSNILLGAVAALATYLLGAYKLELLNQLGIALVSGVGGGNVLTSLAQKQQAKTQEAQTKALTELLERKLFTPPNELKAQLEAFEEWLKKVAAPSKE